MSTFNLFTCVLWCFLYFLFPVSRSKGSVAPVMVLIRWEPPSEGDLPVHNYRVTWMSRQTHAAHKHTHTLRGHTHLVQNNMHTRPTHARTAEPGKKESSSRVTQGVRTLDSDFLKQKFLWKKKCQQSYKLITIKLWIDVVVGWNLRKAPSGLAWSDNNKFTYCYIHIIINQGPKTIFVGGPNIFSFRTFLLLRFYYFIIIGFLFWNSVAGQIRPSCHQLV